MDSFDRISLRASSSSHGRQEADLIVRAQGAIHRRELVVDENEDLTVLQFQIGVTVANVGDHIPHSSVFGYRHMDLARSCRHAVKPVELN